MATFKVHTLLNLLDGPTKSLVASALTVGVGGACVTSLSPLTAQCFVVRQPYDEDVFELHGSGSTSAHPPHDILGRTTTNSLYKKRRPVGIEALNALLSSRNLTLTFTRNIGLSSLLVIHEYLHLLLELEEEAAAKDRDEKPIYPPMPTAALIQSSIKGAVNGCLDLATQLLRSLLDWAATATVSPYLSNKLRKDMRASALRKCANHPWYLRAGRVTKTSLFSEATLYTADWMVACGLEVYRSIAGRHSPGESGAEKGVVIARSKRLQKLLVRISLQGARCTILWATVSFCNGVGSISPVYPTFAMFLLTQCFSILVNSYCAAFIARFTADTSGGGDRGFDARTLLPPPPAAAAATPESARTTRDSTDTLSDILGGGPAALAFGNDSTEHDLFRLLSSETPHEPHHGDDAHMEHRTSEEDREEPPVPPAAPTPQQRRPRGGPVLPERRRRGGGGIVSAFAGPETPQAREPRLAAEDAPREDRAMQQQQPVGGGGADASPVHPVTPPGATHGAPSNLDQ